MRKLLPGIFVLLSFFSSAQDLKTIQFSIAANDFVTARQQIDGFFKDPKNAAEAPAWYYKGRIYTEFVRQHDTSNYKLLQDAFAAYKRYQQLDANNKLMQLNDNVDLFQLYDLSYNLAAGFYNREQYAPAYHYFKLALDVEHYIVQKRFAFQGKSFPALDTSLVNLTGSAAYLAGREEEAIPHFEQLANAGIVGQDFKGVYALLYQYYSVNNATKAAKYLNAGRQRIPDEEYWIRLELGNAAGEKERFTRYEQMLQKYPSSTLLMNDYAVELFNYVYAEEQPADFTGQQKRLQALLTKALSIDSTSAMANFIMAQHVYNQAFYMETALREMNENTAAEQAQKKSFAQKLDQKYEDILKYSLKSYELLCKSSDATDKSNCRKIVNQLIAYYRKKNNSEQVNFWTERLKGM